MLWIDQEVQSSIFDASFTPELYYTPVIFAL